MKTAPKSEHGKKQGKSRAEMCGNPLHIPIDVYGSDKKPDSDIASLLHCFEIWFYLETLFTSQRSPIKGFGLMIDD